MRRRVIFPATVLTAFMALQPGAVAQDAQKPDAPVTPVSAPSSPVQSEKQSEQPTASNPGVVPPSPSVPAAKDERVKLDDPAPAAPAASGTAAEATEKTETAKPETAPAPAAVTAEPPKTTVAEPAPSAAPAFQLDIAAVAQKSGPKSGIEKRESDAIVAFYAARQNAPLWHGEKGRTPAADALIAEIGRAGDWALDASQLDPGLANSAPVTDATPEQRAADEYRINQAFLKYARHARGGRIPDPTSLTLFLDRKPVLYDPATLLDRVAAAKEPAAYLLQLHPQHPQFERLRQQYLQQYLAMRKVGGAETNLPRIPDGPRITAGQSHAHVALVRQRLGVGAPDDTRYDAALVSAVKEYQSQKGLKPADGTIGNGTRSALNGGVQGNPKKLLANLEQWRWMPDDLGRFYVTVNIPEFTMRVVQDGKVIHTEKVITGKTDTQTPIFSDEMEQVIFHPFWGVPDGIKQNEIQPGLARGQYGVLAKHNLRIASGGRDIDPASVNWQTADLRKFHVYQPPGGDNVLGVVKFRFPNKHDVYMHDTPTKGLFSTAVRTYSHGCMRVQNPLRFAEILLAEDKKMASDRVRALAAPGAPQNNTVLLTRRIPVHITYFTASVDDDGKARYFSDIYGHENRINLALDGKAHLVAKVEKTKDPVRAEPVASLTETKASRRDWVRDVFVNN